VPAGGVGAEGASGRLGAGGVAHHLGAHRTGLPLSCREPAPSGADLLTEPRAQGRRQLLFLLSWRCTAFPGGALPAVWSRGGVCPCRAGSAPQPRCARARPLRRSTVPPASPCSGVRRWRRVALLLEVRCRRCGPAEVSARVVPAAHLNLAALGRGLCGEAPCRQLRLARGSSVAARRPSSWSAPPAGVRLRGGSRRCVPAARRSVPSRRARALDAHAASPCGRAGLHHRGEGPPR
jgi:hypothetical protein